MSEQTGLFGTEWSREDTRDFLTIYPLPSDLVWPHRDGGKRPVHPTYRVSGGYGKWLWETPYFPGLFELIHEILVNARELPTADLLADELRRILAAREAQQELPVAPSTPPAA